MGTSSAVRRWVLFVLTAGLAATILVHSRLESAGLALPLALILGIGVAAVIPLALRYRIGGATHALTADEAILVAMLLVLPPAWPPAVLCVGVAIGHLIARRPLIRVAFNVGIVGLSSSLATIAYVRLADGNAPFSVASLFAMVLAMLLYAAVSVVVIAVLFHRLGSGGIGQGIREVLPASRITLPGNIVAGVALGWFGSHGAALAAMGVGLLTAGFAAYRTNIGAQRLRDQAARLRDVAQQLVAGSASLDAFDEGLGHVAELFGANLAELFIAGDHHRVVEVGGARIDWASASPAARAGLELERAESFAGGTETGGEQGALVAPIVRHGVTIGSLALHARRGLEPWDDADQDLLDGVAGEVLVAMHNAQLVEQIAGEREVLAAQTELLGGILYSVSDGIALIGEEGDILSWNPAMSAIVGRPDDEQVLGEYWLDVLDVVDERDLKDSILEALSSSCAGRTLTRTWRLRSTDADAGEARWIRAVLSPAPAPDRRAAVLVASDVTAVREVDRLKADFLATVSHELRTPLTPLKGFLELDSRKELVGEQRELMRASMRRQVDRLEALIGDLLAMAELDRDLVDVAHTPMDLGDIVARVASRHELASRVTLGVRPLQVIGDEHATERIVHALIDNALKHTAGPVEVEVGDDGRQGWATVRDHGPGIRPADRDLIFDRFARLGDHLLRTQGPGLGLPIARALARRLDGDVVVETSSAEGSVFRLQLPLL